MSCHLSLSLTLLSVVAATVSAEEKICDFDAIIYLSSNNIVFGKSTIQVKPNKNTDNPLYSVIQQTLIETSQIVRQVWEPIDNAFPASNSCSNESKNVFSHVYNERSSSRVSFKVIASNETTKRLCAGRAKTNTMKIDNMVVFTFSAINSSDNSFLGFDVKTNVDFDNDIDGFLPSLFPKNLIESFENLTKLFVNIDVSRGIQTDAISPISFMNLHFNRTDGFKVFPTNEVIDKNGVVIQTQVRYDNGNLIVPNETINFTRHGKTNAVKSCLVMKRLCNLSSKFVDSPYRFHQTPKKLLYSNAGSQAASYCYINKVYFTGR